MRILYLCLFCMIPGLLRAQEMTYTVTPFLENSPYFRVELTYSGFNADSLQFSMPVWTPGYYQFMDYALAVRNMRASDANGQALSWKQQDANSWTVYKTAASIHLQYEVRSTRPFVAANFLDTNRAYISPAGMWLISAKGSTQ